MSAQILSCQPWLYGITISDHTDFNMNDKQAIIYIQVSQI